MKTLATIAAVGLMLVPGVAAACQWGMKDQTAQISCAEGQVYDADTRACIPQTS